MKARDIGFEAIPGLDLVDGEPVFSEPWEAQAFALVVSLHEKGLFAWSEWAEVLGEIISSQPKELPYYQSWLLALEAMVERKSLAGSKEIQHRKSQWKAAVAATPHGTPIELENADRQI